MLRVLPATICDIFHGVPVVVFDPLQPQAPDCMTRMEELHSPLPASIVGSFMIFGERPPDRHLPSVKL